jgi:SusD family.
MKTKLYISLAVALAFCVSCDKFLDVVPDNRTVLDNPESVQELLVSAYPNAQYYHICEIMSDNASERSVTGSHSRMVLNEEMYKWQEGFQAGTGQDTPFYLWSNCYNSIAAANQALASIAEAPDPEKYRAQKGEALVCRAYAHFILVNMFAEHYNPSTSGQTMGIPYAEEPENVVIKHYTRNSVAEVYQLIEKDLTEGMPLLDDKVYSVPKYHFTKAAAHAFASRFYLFKGDWDKVLEHAHAVLSGNISDRILPLGTVAFTGAASGEYEIRYRAVEQPNILLMIGAASWWGRDSRSSSLRYGMTVAQNTALFTSTNVTGNSSTYYRRWLNSAAGAYYMYKHYEYFKYSYPGASTGVGYVMGAHFTIEEVLLMRAEAYVMKGGAANVDLALADFNTLLAKRINTGTSAFTPVTLTRFNTFYSASTYPALSPFYDLTEEQRVLLNGILDWRRKEFMSDGIRWFDIKRFHIEVVHTFPNTNQPTMTLTGNDPRRALQIPMEAQAFGVPANPR